MGHPGLTIEELRRQYRTDLTPNAGVHQARYAQESEAVLARVPNHALDVAYGPAGERQTLDIFAPAAARKAPVLLFIHGGYWYFNSKNPRRFPAAAWTQHGVLWVPINYRLAPTVILDEIARDVRAAVAWVHAHIEDYGGDPDRIFVCGNSAGGHLTVMTLVDDWTAAHGLPVDVVKGACAVSGLYDLEPLLLSVANEHIRMDAATAARNSPVSMQPTAQTPLILAVGANETDEFRRQTRLMVDAWRGHGLPTTHMEIVGHDHFSVLGEFANPDCVLFQALARQIGVAE